MENLFKNTAELRKYVRLNASMPFDSIEPYINHAYRKFLFPYIGPTLSFELEEFIDNGDDDKLKIELIENIKRTVAPFAVMIATHETSILFGETGHTVSRTDSLAPASDAKIQLFVKALNQRAYENLEALVEFLEANAFSFPSWEDAPYYIQRESTFFDNTEEFQNKGAVNIAYSRLTFESLRSIIAQVEQTELIPAITENLFNILAERYKKTNSTTTQATLIFLIQRFLASRSACIFSSASADDPLGYATELQKLPSTEGNNFYCSQAQKYLAKIQEFVNLNADELGVDVTSSSNTFVTPRTFSIL